MIDYNVYLVQSCTENDRDCTYQYMVQWYGCRRCGHALCCGYVNICATERALTAAFHIHTVTLYQWFSTLF